MEISINYLAVVVAAIANMAVGYLWYGPVFGKQWKALMGFTPESMKQMKITPQMAMVGGVVTSLIMAYVLAHFINLGMAYFPDASALKAGIHTAFWAWLGFTATTIASSFLWEGKPFNLFLLNASQSFVALIVMSLILVLWP